MSHLPPLYARPTRTLTCLHGLRCRLWTAAEMSAAAPMRVGLLVAATINHTLGAAAPIHRRMLADAIADAGHASPIDFALVAPIDGDVIEDAGALGGADKTAIACFVQAVIELRTAQRQHENTGCRLASARALEAEQVVDGMAQSIAKLLGT